MPFANDLIEHNRERLAQQGAGGTLQSRFIFQPTTVMALLRARIVGQEAVLEQVEAMLKVLKVDIGERERPLTVNLFMGPTGVGKSEIVRLLAEAIHGRADAFCRIDMHTLAQEHYAAALTGAPPGYVGSKEGTTLFDAEAIQGSFSRPGIVLFDELEKASKEVLRSLLGILEHGQLRLAAGTHTLDFRNSLIFMTSNIGAREVSDYRARFQQGWRRWLGLRPHDEARILQRALHRHFEPEFLNRIDRILEFRHIEDEWLQALLEIELSKLNQRLAKQGRALRLDESAQALLCREYDVRFGARAIGRRVRTELEPAVADCLLANPAIIRLIARVEDGLLRVSADN
jgi:ATP-dependent Clp protease ATP-binding subunit ClpA